MYSRGRRLAARTPAVLAVVARIRWLAKCGTTRLGAKVGRHLLGVAWCLTPRPPPSPPLCKPPLSHPPPSVATKSQRGGKGGGRGKATALISGRHHAPRATAAALRVCGPLPAASGCFGSRRPEGGGSRVPGGPAKSPIRQAPTPRRVCALSPPSHAATAPLAVCGRPAGGVTRTSCFSLGRPNAAGCAYTPRRVRLPPTLGAWAPCTRCQLALLGVPWLRRSACRETACQLDRSCGDRVECSGCL